MRRLDVVGAVIVRDGQVLCARRGPGGPTGDRWEFPGGKVEPGETEAAALVREVAEELGCTVEVGEHVATTEHSYDDLAIRLSAYLCTLVDGEPVPTEHAEVRWADPHELWALDWAPADIPVVEILSAGRSPAEP